MHSSKLLTALLSLCLLAACTKSADPGEAESGLLGQGYGIDHAVLVVRDLAAASSHFSDTLGFQMPPPERHGKHPTGTINASAYFADYSYLELLAVGDAELVELHRPHYLKFLEQHQGVRLYALSTSSADATHAWLNTRGFAVDAPLAGRVERAGWQRDSDEPDWWSVRFQAAEPPADWPFFIQYRRVPYRELAAEWNEAFAHSRSEQRNQHPNGTLGIAAIEIAVTDLPAARDRLLKMGLPAQPSDRPTQARIGVQRGSLLLRAAEDGSEVTEFLAARGAGVMGLHLEVENLAATRAFLSARLPAGELQEIGDSLIVPASHAYGVRLVFVEEDPASRPTASGPATSTMSEADLAEADGIYQRYCALCHGADREGYAADHAPSLRSPELLASAYPMMLYQSTLYGRPGTAMAAYGEEMGGPLSGEQIGLLTQWLWEVGGSPAPIRASDSVVRGDLQQGSALYQQHCVECHGGAGEGITAPALGNPMLLSLASDSYLRFAISEGRQGTPMPAYRDLLNAAEIDALTAFLRSRAAGWQAPIVNLKSPPEPRDYVLNPQGPSPQWQLREGRFVAAEQVRDALAAGSRMVLLDARAMSDWQRAHIPGAVPVPYYAEPDTFAHDLPRDGTWIIVYCACPHAASGVVVDSLRRLGFRNTAIIDEGVIVWAQRGYPLSSGVPGD